MLDDMPGATRTGRGLRRPVLWVLAAVVTVVLVVSLWAFQPWKVFTSSNLDETLPAPRATSPVAAQPAPAQPAPAQPAPAQSATASSPIAVQPAVVAEGSFVSQEHETSGLARVLTLPDGSRVLRFENLASSDGPDLHVWLTDQAAGGDDAKYDDGRYVTLGKLKATHGNHNYAIPADAELTGLRSVVIWCDRFNVAFGSAPLVL